MTAFFKSVSGDFTPGIEDIQFWWTCESSTLFDPGDFTNAGGDDAPTFSANASIDSSVFKLDAASLKLVDSGNVIFDSNLDDLSGEFVGTKFRNRGTIGFWARVQNALAALASAQLINIGTLPGQRVRIFLRDNGRIEFIHVASTTTTITSGNGVVPTATFFYVEARWDSDIDALELYVDGVLVASNYTAISAISASSSFRITIGLSTNSTNTYNLDNIVVSNAYRRLYQYRNTGSWVGRGNVKNQKDWTLKKALKPPSGGVSFAGFEVALRYLYLKALSALFGPSGAVITASSRHVTLKGNIFGTSTEIALTNPGFETGDFTDWTPNAFVTIESLEQISELYSARLESVRFGPPPGNANIAQLYRLVTGLTPAIHVLEFKSRWAHNAYDLAMRVQAYENFFVNLLGQVETNSQPPDQNNTYGIYFEIPGSGQVYLIFTGLAGTIPGGFSSTFLDDVRLYRQDPTYNPGVVHAKTSKINSGVESFVGFFLTAYGPKMLLLSGGLGFSGNERRMSDDGLCLFDYPSVPCEALSFGEVNPTILPLVGEPEDLIVESLESCQGIAYDQSLQGGLIVYNNVTCCPDRDTQIFSYAPPSRDSELTFGGSLETRPLRTLSSVLGLSGFMDRHQIRPVSGVLSFDGQLSNNQSIPVPYMWFRADFMTSGGSGGFVDGQAIGGAVGTQWYDYSGNGRHTQLKSGGAGDITFETNEKNGKPAVRFTSDGRGEFNAAHAFTDYTIFAVYKQDSAVGSPGFAARSTVSTDDFIQMPSDPAASGTSENWRIKYSLNEPPGGTYVPRVDANWTVTTYTLHALRRTGLAHEMYISGVSIGSTSTDGFGTPLTGTLNFDRFRTLNGVSLININLAEIIYYDRALTNAEVDKVEAYLNNKYAL